MAGATVTEDDDEGDDCGEFVDPRGWVDDLPRAYHDILPLLGLRRPSLFKLRRDEADLYFTEANTTASRDGTPSTYTTPRFARYFAVLGDAHEAWVTYLRRFKAKKALTGEERVTERRIYSRVFDPAEHKRSVKVVDGLLAALEDASRGCGGPSSTGSTWVWTYIDTATDDFYAPEAKLAKLSQHAKQLRYRTARNARWLRVRDLQSQAGWAQYMCLAIPAARFFLRELDDVNELKTVWLAVEFFMPHLAGRRVPLHEDNHAVCNVLAGRTSRSLDVMAELWRLWYLLDNNGIHIRTRYIRSAANVWADRLSRRLDSDDC
eukprot:jgi/Tetstr1/462406/TSEL_007412.t1